MRNETIGAATDEIVTPGIVDEPAFFMLPSRAVLRGALICLSLVLLAACGEEDEPRVLGSPSDVKTAPGPYDGFEIIDQCELAYDYGVLGTGTRWFDDVAPGDPGRSDALFELSSLLRSTLADIDSVHNIGWGSSCTGGTGASTRMSDYRDVDTAFEIVGRMLRERDLREEISISVSGIPVAAD